MSEPRTAPAPWRVDARGPTLVAPDRTNELAAERTELAFHRTRMGADRTLLAITRTSLALIGFGFTLFKFLQHLDVGHPGSKRLGFALVVLGLLVQLLGVWQHVDFVRGLRREWVLLGGPDELGRAAPHAALLISGILVLLGLATTVWLAFSIGS